MGKEIERKFLVKNDSYKKASQAFLYRQGYICTDKERVVRIRVYDNKGFITIKGENVGISRAEYEYEIPYNDAEEIINNLCYKPIIEKIRCKFEFQGFVWEVDEFHGENEGLIVAEIELSDENQAFSKPAWVGEEVTDDHRYSNANLVKNPYKNWRT